jgi:hypothetical protein
MGIGHGFVPYRMSLNLQKKLFPHVKLKRLR